MSACLEGLLFWLKIWQIQTCGALIGRPVAVAAAEEQKRHRNIMTERGKFSVPLERMAANQSDP